MQPQQPSRPSTAAPRVTASGAAVSRSLSSSLRADIVRGDASLSQVHVLLRKKLFQRAAKPSARRTVKTFPPMKILRLRTRRLETNVFNTRIQDLPKSIHIFENTRRYYCVFLLDMSFGKVLEVRHIRLVKEIP